MVRQMISRSVLIFLFCIGCTAPGESKDDGTHPVNQTSFTLLDNILDISKEYYSSDQISQSRAFVENEASVLRGQIKKGMRPEDVIKLINNELFSKNGFKYEKSLDNIDFALLPSVIAKKRGNCIGLSSLYAVIGEKIGFPLFAAIAPTHLFVMFNDGSKKLNIETADDGNIHDNLEYIERFHIPTSRIDKVYLRPLDKKQTVALIKSNIAVALIKKGKNDEAIALNAMAIKDLADDPGIRSNLAVAYSNKGHPSEAIEQLKIAISLYPENIWYHLNLAEIYTDNKQDALAAGEYRAALAVDPRLDSVDIKSRNSIFSHALGAFQKAGEIYFKSKKYDEALEVWSDYLTIHESDPDIQNNVAIILYLKQDYKGAMEHAKLAAKYGRPVDREVMASIQSKLK